MARPQVADIGTASDKGGKLNKQSRTADGGGPPAWGLGEVLTTPLCKNFVKKHSLAECLLWRLLCMGVKLRR